VNLYDSERASLLRLALTIIERSPSRCDCRVLYIS